MHCTFLYTKGYGVEDAVMIPLQFINREGIMLKRSNHIEGMEKYFTVSQLVLRVKTKKAIKTKKEHQRS